MADNESFLNRLSKQKFIQAWKQLNLFNKISFVAVSYLLYSSFCTNGWLASRDACDNARLRIRSVVENMVRLESRYLDEGCAKSYDSVPPECTEIQRHMQKAREEYEKVQTQAEELTCTMDGGAYSERLMLEERLN